jgi:D-serine deaminase-like pyridoxal phosphate-dependent protein
MRTAALDTPAALIDETRMMRNIQRLQSRLDGFGVRFRPHVKTPKCVEIGLRQRIAGARGITVSTLKEAERFFAAGFDDVLYAVGVAPSKLSRVLALREAGCDITVVVDSEAAAKSVVQVGRPLSVMIEVDSDGHRAGVEPESEVLTAIGRRLIDGGADLRGVMAHAGSSYLYATPDALAEIAEGERSGCVRAAERLRAAGLPCPQVSVGSTPTALSARRLEGVTEVRAGVYVFQDLVMTNVGVCTPDDIALSVLTTVIGHQRRKGWVLIDAGWMALSRDRGTQLQSVDYGYGAVCDEGGRLLEGLWVSGVNQEHGFVSRRGTDPARRSGLETEFPIGTRLRILPNHACATAAQFSQYMVLETGGGIATWERFNGW